jgi:hypothetical protein
VAATHHPQPRHQQEHQRIDDDRVGQGEEPGGADPEHQRGDGDERVRGVNVAAEQEPGHDRAEFPTGQAPLVEDREVAAPPARRDEPHHRDQGEQGDEHPEGDTVDRGEDHRTLR